MASKWLESLWSLVQIIIIPLRAKRVGECIEIRHNKISPTRILSTLRCLSLCHSVTLRPINYHSCASMFRCSSMEMFVKIATGRYYFTLTLTLFLKEKQISTSSIFFEIFTFSIFQFFTFYLFFQLLKHSRIFCHPAIPELSIANILIKKKSFLPFKFLSVLKNMLKLDINDAANTVILSW